MSLLSLGWAYFRRRMILVCAALAIALGVGILYTVLAVFNGFLQEFEYGIREFSGDVAIELGERADLSAVNAAIASLDEVKRTETRLNWFGMAGRRGTRNLDDPRSADLSGLLMIGMDDSEILNPDKGEALSFGEMIAARPQLELPGTPREPDAPPLLLGTRLAEKLGLKLGDAIEIFSYHGATGAAPTPVRTTFQMVGNFETGRYDQDLDRMLVRRTDLAAMVQRQQPYSELLLFTDRSLDAEKLAEEVRTRLQLAGLRGPDYRVRTWRTLGSTFLLAAEDQKGILATVFAMIVLVAAYQLVATLLLTVAEKRRDMGILGALGASPRRVTAFFVGLGLLISSLGCALGLLLGDWLIHHLETVETWIGGGERIFVPEIYKFEHIPVAVDVPGTLAVIGFTLLSATVFSMWPAWRASRMPIVRALRPR